MFQKLGEGIPGWAAVTAITVTEESNAVLSILRSASARATRSEGGREHERDARLAVGIGYLHYWLS